MDYNSEEIETGTDAQPMRTDPDFRVTDESEKEWADLEGRRFGNVRHPYWIHQCQPNEGYSGVLDCMDVDEARALFGELFERFHVYDGLNGFPLPPEKLPGFAARGFSDDEPAAKLLSIGIEYALAIVKNERRTMHLRWQDAEHFIRKLEDEAKAEVVREEIFRAMDANEARAAFPQLVYFIGSDSGPIKIGMAVRPLERLKTLQTGHHERLELLATCEGGQKAERAYHKRFKAHRLNGEWFKRVPEIEAEIERLGHLDT